jgi:hypothetical protein
VNVGGRLLRAPATKRTRSLSEWPGFSFVDPRSAGGRGVECPGGAFGSGCDDDLVQHSAWRVKCPAVPRVVCGSGRRSQAPLRALRCSLPASYPYLLHVRGRRPVGGCRCGRGVASFLSLGRMSVLLSDYSEVDCRQPGAADVFVPRCWDGSILMHDFDKSMKDAVRYFQRGLL